MKIRYLVLGGALGGGVTLQKVFICFFLIRNLNIVILEIPRMEGWYARFEVAG